MIVNATIGLRRFSIKPSNATDADTVRFAINRLISGNQVFPYGPDSSVYQPRHNLNLDPAQAAVDLGASPELVMQIVERMDKRNERLSQTVDEGALMLDELLGSNLSGARKPETTRVRVAPDATYKIQPKGPAAFPSLGGKQGASTDMEFIRLANTPMMDWDKPDQYHMDRNVTVRNLADVEELTRDYVKQHPESMLRLYLSPGGYRAWEVGEAMTPKEFAPRFDELQVDPDYARLSQTPPRSEGEGFASRISHKPGRIDWAAQPLTVIAGEQAIPNARSVQLVETMHDKPIRETYLTDGLGASFHAMQALQEELPGLSASMSRELKRRFHL